MKPPHTAARLALLKNTEMRKHRLMVDMVNAIMNTNTTLGSVYSRILPLWCGQKEGQMSDFGGAGVEVYNIQIQMAETVGIQPSQRHASFKNLLTVQGVSHYP